MNKRIDPSSIGRQKPIKAHRWPRDPNDYYIEEKWCSTRLFEELSFEGAIHDPACGSGRIIEAARAAGYEAHGTDKIRRTPLCEEELDFLEGWPPHRQPPDNIARNPPFRIAKAFIMRALVLCRRKTAMLLPLKCLGGAKRSRWLEQLPLTQVLTMTPRPSMPPGSLIEAGMKPGGGKEDCLVRLRART